MPQGNIFWIPNAFLATHEYYYTWNELRDDYVSLLNAIAITGSASVVRFSKHRGQVRIVRSPDKFETNVIRDHYSLRDVSPGDNLCRVDV